MTKQEIKQKLTDLLKSDSDLLTEEEKMQLLNIELKLQGKTLNELVEEVLQGVQNGYSIETQFELLKTIKHNIQ